MVKIALDARHDPKALGETLRTNGRLQIPNFLEEGVANHLEGLLLRNNTWFVAYNEGHEFFEIPLSGIARMSPEQQNRLVDAIDRGARAGFQYFFHQYYMTDAIRNGREQGHPLHAMHDYVNSEPFLGFMRDLTGDAAITHADSFASRYLPGHFLTEHNDTHAHENRAAAYTISMTRRWQPDWGGNLLFYGEDGNIDAGFTPSFNTLNIFLIPQPHAVSHVAPFSGAPRLSFLGWLKRGERPDY
ncbi:2OG-Fe(II) oxygenase [Kordiimonas marina]|uniref:2OG-Fe(II) oxygenase n=1 Tax=Kordiimonas marina TaxID=2872312 RepID=UPI001FF58A5C|nr:2OG-Fe(II) oxygenase family protein [Kordiimonas marina]MCJ9428036.1 2OG-Fe(II) oxygenase [Kordiimonas marina]